MEEKAGCCYFNCMFTPRLWVSNRAKKKNVAEEIQCNFTVLILSGTVAEITFLCKQTR